MPDSSVLLTGCNGYAGSRILKILSGKLNFVGIDVAPGSNNTETLDLRDYDSLQTLNKYDFDYVLHTAWDQTSRNIYANNVKASGNLFKYLSTRETKGFIFISSYYVSTTVDIQYSRSKLKAENDLFDSGIPFVIIRPDMLYSLDEPKIQEQLSYMRKHFAVSVGDGLALRTPTHISDLARLINQILTSNTFTNKVYEIGSPIPYSQKSLLSIIAKNAGLSPFVVTIPEFLARTLFAITGKVDPEQASTIKRDRVADLTLLQADFGFTPMNFEDGITL